MKAFLNKVHLIYFQTVCKMQQMFKAKHKITVRIISGKTAAACCPCYFHYISSQMKVCHKIVALHVVAGAACCAKPP